MSLRRQPPCVELKDGKPEVKVEMLNASMSNHFTWIVAITNILQSKGLWEGITVNVDPYMVASASATQDEADAARENQETTALLEAMASGDTAVRQAALERAADAGPAQQTLSAIKRDRPLTIKRRTLSTPSTPQFPRGRSGPVGGERGPARFQGLFRREVDGSEDELEPEDDGLEKAKQDFVKKNATALHIIRSVEAKSVLRRPHGAGRRGKEATADTPKILRELPQGHPFVDCENESNQGPHTFTKATGGRPSWIRHPGTKLRGVQRHPDGVQRPSRTSQYHESIHSKASAAL